MLREDAAAVAGLERQVPSPWSRALIEGELGYPGSTALMAFAAGEVAGWCCCRQVGGEAELLKMSVARRWRRRRVATRLLHHLEGGLCEKHVERLYLEVRSKSAPAVSFYTHAGFTVHGRRINYYSQPDDDALLMLKLLFHS